MKRIRSYKLFESAQSIEDICLKYGIRNWTLNDDGSIDVNGDVDLRNMDLTELPLKFGRVTGWFDCSQNKLTSLEGSPNRVGDDFNCRNNNLTSLEGRPSFIGGSFHCDYRSLTILDKFCRLYGIINYRLNSDGLVDVEGSVNLSGMKLTELPIKFGKVTGFFNCSGNKLTSLEGCPNWVGGNFLCYSNKLTSLVGGPSEVGGHFFCSGNRLTSLEGCPEKIWGDLDCENNKIISLDFYPSILKGKLAINYNPIYEIWKNVLEHKPNNHGHYLDLFDLNAPIRFEGNIWVCYREFLNNFFEEIGVPSPKKLKKYKEV